MIKRAILYSSYNSFILMSVLSFISLLLQMLYYTQIKEYPEIRIGFPLNFWNLKFDDSYYQSKICLSGLIINYFIFYLISIFIFLIKKHLEKKHNE